MTLGASQEFSADAGLWLGNEESRGLEPFRAADSPAGWQRQGREVTCLSAGPASGYVPASE